MSRDISLHPGATEAVPVLRVPQFEDHGNSGHDFGQDYDGDSAERLDGGFAGCELGRGDYPGAEDGETMLLNNLIPVRSSYLHSVGYDQRGQRLVIRFKSGLVRFYPEPVTTFQGLMAAKSKGQFFNQRIKHEKVAA